MSSFISSFIVDPVIRQARRFSRSSTHSDLAPAEDPSCDGNGFPHHLRARNMAQEEASLRLDTGSGCGRYSESTIAEHPIVQSPTSDDAGLEGDLQSHQHDSIVASQPNSDSDLDQQNPHSRSRRTRSRIEDSNQNGPLQRTAEQLRSTNASYSSSTYSATDSDMTPVEDSMLLRRHISQEASRGGTDTYNGKMGSGPLPEDDGMGVMRKRILDIQKSHASTKDKSRLIHDLMTHDYNSSQSSLDHTRAQSPASLLSQERPLTPNSSRSPEAWNHHLSPSTSLSSTSAANGDFWYVSPEDLKPSYYTPVSPLKGSHDVDDMNRDKSLEEGGKTLGCAHYMRNVKLQCSVCYRWYTCRFCHDAAEDHPLNRRETKNMLCMLCGCAQRAAGECRACRETAAWYYCGVCKLWDNDPEKNIYHCDDCGICRIGQGLGKDFYHCKVRHLMRSNM